MTAYEAAGFAVVSIAVKTGTFAMRVAKIELVGGGVATTVDVIRYSGSTLTGGTSVTPVPLREGAPASTVTAKTGATVSGTSTGTLHRDSAIAAGASVSYQFVFDLILVPGSALHVKELSGTVMSAIVVHFEELHLARSF